MWTIDTDREAEQMSTLKVNFWRLKYYCCFWALLIYKDGIKVSATLKESTQTYAVRRFPQRGRGFAHATVAGLVSRSRFLWFWLLYGRVRAPMPLFH